MSWLSGWAKRIKITIDADLIDAALSDFPVPVYISAASGIGDVDASCVFDELGSDANRKKIAVTTSDGETQCYVEIERWDHASEKAWLHVGVGSVASATDTELYLYYDSSQADNTTYVGDTGDAAAQAVWDSNYVGVWHLEQDPSTGANAVKDSTSNTLHLTSAGSMTSGDLVDSQFGKGLDFDGVDDSCNRSDEATLDITGQITVEAVLKKTTYPPEGYSEGIASKYRNQTGYSNQRSYTLNVMGPGGQLDFVIGAGISDDNSSLKGAANIVGAAYRHVAGVFVPSTSQRIYVDGALDAEKTTSVLSAAYNGAHLFSLGVSYNSTSPLGHITAIIDEVRLSNTARSAAWLKATYHGLFDSLLTFGAEENLGETIIQVGNEGKIRVLPQAPAEFQWDISGTVREGGAAVARTVRLYKRSNGELVDETVSDAGDGAYSFEGCPPEVCYVVALDDDSGDVFNALILDRVKPGQDFS